MMKEVRKCKQNKGGAEKLKKKVKKTQMVEKEKENKKKGFHKMAIEFIHLS